MKGYGEEAKEKSMGMRERRGRNEGKSVSAYRKEIIVHMIEWALKY